MMHTRKHSEATKKKIAATLKANRKAKRLVARVKKEKAEQYPGPLTAVQMAGACSECGAMRCDCASKCHHEHCCSHYVPGSEYTSTTI